MKHFAWIGCVLLLSLAAGVSADDGRGAVPVVGETTSATAAGGFNPASPDFGRDVKPILARRCFACHGPETAEAGLRLHRKETALEALESGKRAIVPGEVEQSELLARISTTDESLRMPPEGKPLTPAEIARISRWIAEGAEWEEHWAFEPVTNPDLPAVRNAGWVRNPIDRFILARLEARRLEPAEPADRVTLLRRVTYDLTGLPPTPEEVDAFLADDSPEAWRKVIDRLLDSPRYGERWGRHWLDVVRFAETNSFERDGVKPNAWRYRDYVIRSFNDDKPYDRFLREQLAGDELAEDASETIIATGFYRLGLWDDEPVDPLQARYDELDDILRTVGEGILGLTLGCARCHDHKIDPIPQADYYKMLAFFHELTTYGTRGDQRTNSQTDISSPELRAEYERIDGELGRLRGLMQPIEQRGIEKMPAEDQRKSETPERQKLLDAKLKDFLSADDWGRYFELKGELAVLEESRRKLPPRESALSLAKLHPSPPPTFVFFRGNPHVERDAVEPGFPRLFDPPAAVVPGATSARKSSGRRTALADWITSPDNRLTARVMVNRIWQHHFGRGIVRSSNNFGQLGEPPTHPELLDWLAGEFVGNGWRMKPLHRTILLSNAYQMSSAARAAGLEKDPANDLFWRFDMRRLSAEEIRDSIHAVNGRLNLKMFGPGIYPEISQEVLAGQSQPGAGWGQSSAEEQARRSIYIHVKRSLITPLLASFDFPETDTSCEARFATTQPGQALGHLNGKFIHDQAGHFAGRLRRDAGEDADRQIARALRLALSRSPQAEEIAHGRQLIERLKTEHGVAADEALRLYCLLVYNLNEFLYVD